MRPSSRSFEPTNTGRIVVGNWPEVAETHVPDKTHEYPQYIMRVHHIAVICTDYERSRDFYTRVLGMTMLAETYRAERRSHKADLAFSDGIQIELFSFPDPPKRPSRPEACGLRHLALAVSDIEAEVARLVELGVEVEPVRLDPRTNARYTFFPDPDGLPIELYEIPRP